MIRIFNTLTREKEPFTPLVPGKVSMYVCGVTVYDDSHIGHARSAIVFDMIARYLKFRGYEVAFVKNFTDIDDKIILRSQKEKRDWKELTEYYMNAYQKEMAPLKVLSPTYEPRATDHILEMISIIEKLISSGFAYRSGGDVYYRVKAFRGYGKLSRRDLSEESAGARVEVNEQKEDPLDFALWKSSRPGEPFWDSPWGKGRPGWHIECSAMSMRYLGETLDIHGGGEDLVFPHHENEIAQSEAATGKPFSRYWIHNGFVTINAEKMSKSLGNFFTIREVLEKYSYSRDVSGEMLRYFMLLTHYRQPIQFSDTAIAEAKTGLDRFYNLFLKFEDAAQGKAPVPDLSPVLESAQVKFQAAMDDDFNTAEAIGQLHLLRNELNKKFTAGYNKASVELLFRFFREIGDALGLFTVPPAQWQFKEQADSLSDDEIEKLIDERNQARKSKDWKKSDEIRKALTDKGIMIEDKPGGKTVWKR